MLTDQERLRIWRYTDADGMATPHVDTDRYAVPFGLLASDARNNTLIWLVQTVNTGSGAFIRSHEIGDLLYYLDGVLNQIRDEISTCMKYPEKEKPRQL